MEIGISGLPHGIFGRRAVQPVVSSSKAIGRGPGHRVAQLHCEDFSAIFLGLGHLAYPHLVCLDLSLVVNLLALLS